MMRPRVLYFTTFVFYSLSGGRFTATFLEHQLKFTDNWMISAAMAVQLLASSLGKPWLGGMADSWEASSVALGKNNAGRLRIMSLGLLMSTVATLSHSLGGLYTPAHWSELTDESRPSHLPLMLFVYHLILRIIFVLGTGACALALDGLTLAQLEQEGTDKNHYGKERMYGALSWGVSHVLLGPVIDYFGFGAIYGATLLSFAGCVIVIQMYSKSCSTIRYVGVDDKVADRSKGQFEKYSSSMTVKLTQTQNGKRYESKTSSENDDADEDDIVNVINADNTPRRLPLTFFDLGRLLFQNGSVFNVSFISSLFALSIGMSVVESLIFLYFEFLGGSTMMCGMTVCVTVLFELPLFHYAPDFLERLGSTKMLQLGCFAFIVRVIGYSIIPQQHPYLVLFLEPLHGVTIGFAITSSVAFADEWVPTGYESTGQGFMSMIGSLGQGVGLCIGAFLEGRMLYRVLASIVAFGSLLLGIGNYLTTKPRTQEGQGGGVDQSRTQNLELTPME
ncbi:hypothetical protein ACHAXA_005692 [Cyclostephanos tholiformis]|uniref:Major facilitator superfamily associated domain-containing protein n=1 Tax=Cyclostephanos tholiformis TaxID=382380 RepID=A0ABD3SQG5_9STRA